MNVPSHYQLSGNNIHVSYGDGRFTYRDEHQSRTFEAHEIRVLDCDLGQLVSVTTRITTDAGSTSFSVLIPRAQLAGEDRIPIRTHGLTTTHRFSVIAAANTGQLDSFAVVALEGTASRGRR